MIFFYYLNYFQIISILNTILLFLAWVDQPHMLKFEGLEAFQELSNSVTSKQQKAAFCPKSGNMKNIWLQAIQECVSVVGKK